MKKRFKENRLGFHFLFPFVVSMSLCPCLHVHVSCMCMSPWLCIHVHVSRSPCVHVSMCPCLCLNVSMSPSPCLHAYVSTFPEFRKKKMELTENGNFRLFSANGKLNWQTSICLLQMETENRCLFSLVVGN